MRWAKARGLIAVDIEMWWENINGLEKVWRALRPRTLGSVSPGAESGPVGLAATRPSQMLVYGIEPWTD